MVKKDLFKQTVFKSATYYVFHDESLPNKRWLLIGLLFVNEQDLAYVKEVLKTVKEKSDCKSEIHFSKLPTSFKGSFSSKALVAQKWMRLFENRFKEYLSCTILIIDKFSNNFQRDKFAKDYYTYNRFTALALKCGIAWHLSKENIDKLMVNFVSDKKIGCQYLRKVYKTILRNTYPFVQRLIRLPRTIHITHKLKFIFKQGILLKKTYSSLWICSLVQHRQPWLEKFVRELKYGLHKEFWIGN